MPKLADEWGALDVKRAKHSGTKERNEWFAVGGVSGLLLQVTPGGAKSWLLRTTVGAARRGVGLGAWPEVTLADARDRAREMKEKIRHGVDPVEERKAARAALVAARKRGMTFSEAVTGWVESKGDALNEKARKAVLSMMARHAEPGIGKMRLADMTPSDVVRVLAPIWTTTPEQARKLRMTIEQILAWAGAAGHRPVDAPNVARLKGNLDFMLPRLSTVRQKTHQPAVPLSGMRSWWEELCGRQGTPALALRFLTMTAARSGEVRGANWAEVDLDAGLWTIPAARMKMKRQHRVPLPPAVIELLKIVPRMDGSDLVFPAARGGQLSDMAISQVMRRMQADAEKAAETAGQSPDQAGWRDPETNRPAVPHGLRSSFRSWAAERGFDRDMAEIALAHDVAEAVERSYRRTDMLERRRAMTAAWVNFVQGKEPSEVVVAFKAAAR